MQKKRVVVIGGGTGTHTVLRGLKRYQDRLDLTAIVTMADSGGSTGRLRDEFGYLPVGDVRMALAALASDVDDHEELVRELFLHRFSKGHGLNGHNVGNLLLVALTDILGSEQAAISAAAKVLRVRGSVVPVTTKATNLVATYDDGVSVTGEHEIDEPAHDRFNKKIVSLRTDPVVEISDEARAAITNADAIILGPGDVYTSVLANVVVRDVSQTLHATSAKLLYVCNLMTKAGQTTGMGVEEHIQTISTYVGKNPDKVLVNVTPLPKTLMERYASENEYPVALNCESDLDHIVLCDLLASEEIQTKEGDSLKRSLIRHDPDKLAKKLIELI